MKKSGPRGVQLHALAIVLAFGHSPGQFQYNKPQIRHYLYKCFQEVCINVLRTSFRHAHSFRHAQCHSVCQMQEMFTTWNVVHERSGINFYDTCVEVPAHVQALLLLPRKFRHLHMTVGVSLQSSLLI